MTLYVPSNPWHVSDVGFSKSDRLSVNCPAIDCPWVRRAGCCIPSICILEHLCKLRVLHHLVHLLLCELRLAISVLRIELADDGLICFLQHLYCFIDLLDIVRLESFFDNSDFLLDWLLVIARKLVACILESLLN